jgi:hypothetical protein
MDNARTRLLIAIACILSGAAWGHRAHSQADAQGGDEQPLKNVQIFKGKTRKELVAIMKGFARDLGVKCSHCHMKDYSLDDKAEKQTARQMIQMLAELNEKYTILEKKATCYMCHRGGKEPLFGPEGQP